MKRSIKKRNLFSLLFKKKKKKKWSIQTVGNCDWQCVDAYYCYCYYHCCAADYNVADAAATTEDSVVLY